jgi:hypothetical protein
LFKFILGGIFYSYLTLYRVTNLSPEALPGVTQNIKGLHGQLAGAPSMLPQRYKNILLYIALDLNTLGEPKG